MGFGVRTRLKCENGIDVTAAVELVIDMGEGRSAVLQLNPLGALQLAQQLSVAAGEVTADASAFEATLKEFSDEPVIVRLQGAERRHKALLEFREQKMRAIIDQQRRRIVEPSTADVVALG